MTNNLDAHLKDLEERLFDPAIRGSRGELAKLLSADFREIGSSGRIFDFEEIVTALAEPDDEAVRSLEDFSLHGGRRYRPCDLPRNTRPTRQTDGQDIQKLALATRRR